MRNPSYLNDFATLATASGCTTVLAGGGSHREPGEALGPKFLDGSPPRA
jgi:hypothetical protein